ncbi:endonuclease NucS [Haloplanus halophilus]|uniref:endonuclease NucS n=1 Tax=Haloplanus halophilus TaxID=2949993 RepID=UPI00203D7C91|nr:endonuclease NucS [Haloplanus sp. GDY1]
MTVTTLHRPAHRDALTHLEDAFRRGDLITVFGRCTVEYDGRASSSLGPGERLLLLKPDGSALVHTDEQRTPVNWQPPGCDHFASVRDGRLRVRSVRRSPEELLDVRFDWVHHLAAYDVTDPDDLDLQGSEADLKEYVVANPERIDPGFEPLATERETDAGPMDVFGEDEAGRPVAVELKRRRVGPDAVGQLRRYVDALERELGDGTAIRGILVAPSVTDRAATLLERDGLEFVALDPATGRPPDDADA